MMRIAGEYGAYESMPIVWIRPLAHGTDDRRAIAFACPGNKLHARTVTQKLQLLEGSLQLAMAIGEWLVMPSEVYEFSKKFIALLKGSGTQRDPFLASGQHANRCSCAAAAGSSPVPAPGTPPGHDRQRVTSPPPFSGLRPLPAEAEPSPAPPPSGFMLVSGGAQLEMETDSEDDDDNRLKGQIQAGGGPLPSRAEDLLNWHMAGGSEPDLPPTASVGNRQGYVPLYD